MDILHETSPAADLRHGVTVVGTDAVPLLGVDTPKGFNIHRGILIRCPASTAETLAGVAVNTHPVWIGGPGVTPENGFPIPPGNAIRVPIDDAKNLWLISTTISQRVAWISL